MVGVGQICLRERDIQKALGVGGWGGLIAARTGYTKDFEERSVRGRFNRLRERDIQRGMGCVGQVEKAAKAGYPRSGRGCGVGWVVEMDLCKRDIRKVWKTYEKGKYKRVGVCGAG